MGIFDFFKNKNNKNTNDELVEKIYDDVMTVIQVQCCTITGTLAPLNALPKDEWIYGYLFGHVDYYLQVSKLKDDEKSWGMIALRVFRSYYGDKEGTEIFRKISSIQKNKSFVEGQKLGSKEIIDLIKKEVNPFGIVSYLHKKNK